MVPQVLVDYVMQQIQESTPVVIDEIRADILCTPPCVNSSTFFWIHGNLIDWCEKAGVRTEIDTEETTREILAELEKRMLHPQHE